ncbi:SDR family oxidoreductase [Micromonospora sp. WMMD1076]|uniref:SDR family oxidoreductase n=1 Tax=Micromonospora sp. WMMD1076 TaxID=3016103 RepID=UPI00249A8F00|nr:SDR family oxidoreductase [Micromonospora sp. WMMD1076]WFF10150.1 SDR family oxidoreductase [Micromonospora sp. WMMD1076]
MPARHQRRELRPSLRGQRPGELAPDSRVRPTVRGAHGTGRIVSLTSDATVGNLPYGASKGALDRITLAAARELGHLGMTANAVDPGPTDTGWMTAEIQPRRVPVLARRGLDQRPAVTQRRRHLLTDAAVLPSCGHPMPDPDERTRCAVDEACVPLGEASNR